jgi:hypothetical protein
MIRNTSVAITPLTVSVATGDGTACESPVSHDDRADGRGTLSPKELLSRTAIKRDLPLRVTASVAGRSAGGAQGGIAARSCFAGTRLQLFDPVRPSSWRYGKIQPRSVNVPTLVEEGTHEGPMSCAGRDVHRDSGLDRGARAHAAPAVVD